MVNVQKVFETYSKLNCLDLLTELPGCSYSCKVDDIYYFEITEPETMVKLEIGNEKATVNGETKELDVPVFTEQGRTFLPVRFVAEALGANVNWDAATKTVTIWK